MAVRPRHGGPAEEWRRHDEPPERRRRGAGPGGQDGSGGKSPFYILATSPLADEHGLVLKHGETFGVFDHYGDVRPTGLGEEGLYHEGTRYLSCLLLALEHARPMFLSSTVRQDNELLTVDLTNPDVSRGGRVEVPRGTLHLARTKFLRDGACYERLRLRNYGLAPMSVSLALHFEADFADLFEVRGAKRARRGEFLGEEASSDGGRARLPRAGRRHAAHAPSLFAAADRGEPPRRRTSR